MFSFFLASTEMAGWSSSWKARTCRLMYFELGIAIGVVLAFLVLPIGLQAVPQVVEQGCDRLMAHRMTPRFSSSATLRTLLEVQHRGDCGSPLV